MFFLSHSDWLGNLGWLSKQTTDLLRSRGKEESNHVTTDLYECDMNVIHHNWRHCGLSALPQKEILAIFQKRLLIN